ncbi:MAG: PD40 domain-containing protein [Lentisphaeria bacterium]|nr:PD40 domain-containing protein [Lentisphaeria bacterium]
MSKKIIVMLLLTGALAGLLPSVSASRVIEIRKKAELNPTIAFAGVPGDQKLSADIKRFLAFSGWFDAVPAGRYADYTVKAEKSGTYLTVYLYRGEQRLTGWRFRDSGNSRAMGKSVVDTIIEYVFQQLKVKGFCHSRIAFAAETAPGVRNIFLCDIDGGNVEQLTAYRTLNVEPCWSPTGKTVCFSKYGKSGIDIVETTVQKPRRSRILTSFRGINTGAAISPDGKYMAAILSPDHQVDLYVLGLAGRSQTRLTRGIAVEASPCWSPDGRKLAFVSDSRGNPRIFTVNSDGSGLTMLPSVGIDAVTPAWSSDGKIAYATRLSRAGNYVLAVYDLDSKENKVVSKGAGSWESPCWAADNRQVVCKRILNNKSSLWIVDTRTGRERELLHTGSELFDPAWSPCTKR